LGNWYPSVFEKDGVRYVNTEQYMMYQKALLMGDAVTAEAIMQEHNPHNIKKLGQQVKPWDEDKWKANRTRIMYEGCLAKFASDDELKAKLFSTENTILVEASPFDKIWGIGMKAENPKAKKIKEWKGMNLLGRVLMQVREDLRAANHK
jgi:ribA/ribD-fused uncharacterized protein